MWEINVEQGTKEWLEHRLSKITGTKLKDIMSKSSTKAYKNLIYKLIAEKFSEPKENFVSEAMQRGIELESEAIAEYTDVSGIEIEEIGFCISDDFDFLGLSPDGMTLDRKHAVEVKCPDSHTHAKYIAEEKIPPEYKWQIVNYFIVNEKLETLDFISYDPRFFRKDLTIFILRIKRENLEKEIEEAREKILEFQDDWNEVLYNFYLKPMKE